MIALPLLSAIQRLPTIAFQSISAQMGGMAWHLFGDFRSGSHMATWTKMDLKPYVRSYVLDWSSTDLFFYFFAVLPFLFLISSIFDSYHMKTECVWPWYNCSGWLGVKHQVTYLNMNACGDMSTLLQALHGWSMSDSLSRECLWASLCIIHCTRGVMITGSCAAIFSMHSLNGPVRPCQCFHWTGCVWPCQLNAFTGQGVSDLVSAFTGQGVSHLVSAFIEQGESDIVNAFTEQGVSDYVSAFTEQGESDRVNTFTEQGVIILSMCRLNRESGNLFCVFTEW